MSYRNRELAYLGLVGGLTGAQWMCIGIVPIALWILIRVRPAVHELEAAEAAAQGGEPRPAGPVDGTAPGETTDVDAVADVDAALDVLGELRERAVQRVAADRFEQAQALVRTDDLAGLAAGQQSRSFVHDCDIQNRW